MKKITGNEPAMPITHEPIASDGYGLTIRQHFAAIAMEGILARSNDYNETIAMVAVNLADALIAALNTPPSQ